MPKCERIGFKGNMSKKNDKRKLSNNSWLNFLDTLTSVIIIPILALSIICSIIMMNAKRSNNVPNIFGYSLVTILSESMVNSGFEVDEAVMVKNTDPDELQVGDIIAYYKYIETVNANLSDIAQAGMSSSSAADSTEAHEFNTSAPAYSTISSWKLYLSRLFSNLTYTSSEASEKAIKANSTIIFHQIVDIVEYDGYRWFKTWGTSNVGPKGDPAYDPYWIREDYVIGRYTHTSSTVRSFLSFASTNTGILWMVEVPSGVHLILSTLELVEILDMMTKERHERIKNGTYIDRREYKKMLRAKRKMLASGNIDLEAFKKMFPNYNNFEIVYSEIENNKQNVNINGPPNSDGYADDEHMLYGTGATSKVGESPPNKWAVNGRDGPPGGEGESPPNGSGPPSGESPPNRTGPPNKESPPNRTGPPGKESPPNRTGPPGKESPPGSAPPPRDVEPKARADTMDNSSGEAKVLSAESNHNAEATMIGSNIDKSVYEATTGGLYDVEDRETEVRELRDIQYLAYKENDKSKKAKLNENQIVLTHEDIQSMTDIYHWANADFIANTNLTNKGVVTSPSPSNKIYLVSKKTRRQYDLSSLGTIYSVNTGIITTDTGMYKCILSTSGVKFEEIRINPNLTVISAKQDIFGNVFVGVKGGGNAEVTYKTSDGKLVSVWNRNALLTIGDNFKLYYISMENSFDIKKGKITDLKVMNKDGKLVSVNTDSITETIRFVDGFDKYGFMYLTPSLLCLDKGRMFFVLATAETFTLPENAWLTKDQQIAVYKKKSKQIVSYSLREFLKMANDGVSVDDDTGGTVTVSDVLKITPTDQSLKVDCASGNRLSIDLFT